MADAHEGVRWRAHAMVEKWTAEQAAHVSSLYGVASPSSALLRQHFEPYEVVHEPGNLLTTAGLTRLMSLLTAGGAQAATATSARIGVGDGAGTAAIGDTDLSAASGSSHRYFQIMDATYPSAAAGVVTFHATFDINTANFVWNEWCVDIGTPTVSGGATVNACLLNHKTSAGLGTKTSAGSWALTATLTIS